VFIGNPNLLAELVRVGRLTREGRRYVGADLRVLHGSRLTEAIHDKGLQQSLLRRTGIRPLDFFEASTPEQAVRQTQAMLQRNAVVLKPNAGSGGAGIRVVVPGMSDAEIKTVIDSVMDDCRAKYGENVERMVLPLRGFEFVRSTDYPMDDGGHIWDLRIGVLFEPGRAQVFPVSLRVAPDPFDEQSFHRSRAQWVSNVSGRQVTLLKSGMDDEVLNAVGMTQEKLDRALQASLGWTLKAWDAAIRDGGANGSVYEDECESSDPSFYPVEKFAAGGRG
jgi:hypothetical protein